MTERGSTIERAAQRVGERVQRTARHDDRRPPPRPRRRARRRGAPAARRRPSDGEFGVGLAEGGHQDHRRAARPTCSLGPSRVDARSGCTRALMHRLESGRASPAPQRSYPPARGTASRTQPRISERPDPLQDTWVAQLDRVEAAGLASRDAPWPGTRVRARDHRDRRRRGQATPGTVFALQTSRPCVAGTCRALLTYDLTGLVSAVTVEVDWDTRDSAGGFRPDDAIDCTPALPDDPDYDPFPCEANSPAFRVPGTAQVAIRVTDTVDGTQASATPPVDVAGARPARPSPASAARDRRPVRASPGRRAVRPRWRPPDRRRRGQGPATTGGRR